MGTLLGYDVDRVFGVDERDSGGVGAGTKQPGTFRVDSRAVKFEAGSVKSRGGLVPRQLRGAAGSPQGPPPFVNTQKNTVRGRQLVSRAMGHKRCHCLSFGT